MHLLRRPRRQRFYLADRKLAVITNDTLPPKLARVLKLRREIGLRSSGHTLVKMLQPFTTKAIRLVSVTHPEYLERMRAFFTSYAANALLLRGAEGEAVAHPRREPVIEWLDGKTAEVWRTATEGNPALPHSIDPAVTAHWIKELLAGKPAAPEAIAHQAACCVRAWNYSSEKSMVSIGTDSYALKPHANKRLQ